MYHKDKIKQCFNRAVLSYDLYSYPQQMIGTKLIEHIYQYIQNAHLIADLGCGTGLVTEQLSQQITFQKLYALDFANELLKIAKERLSNQKIYILNKEFDRLSQCKLLFNLIFSNMSLHWSENIYETLFIIQKNMAENSILAFTIPLHGTFIELNPMSRNQFYKLSDISRHLINMGFTMIECFEESFIFNFNSWIKALKSIKATGANYIFNRDKPICHNIKAYVYPNNIFKNFSLTYQIGYLIVKKTHVY